ncbi:MAG: Transcriptional regulator, putative [uncultured Sulfurovum sp.]|uniref:Transcriptional regulator, putative n=1 Tax=uncultured Sulfurovum sp. TaxID=269237 RepID=A0A6S6T8Y5_9BACT|nr:MAG: Transcriptional regulator, putative [uncultured Sulfurovum sp.]
MKKQHERHNEILERLGNGEQLSITQLANEWQTTTKTVQRDFSKLMEGHYGVIRASDGRRFTLAKKQCTFKSADTTIKMLESLSADIGGEFYTKAHVALCKLQRFIDSPFYTRIDIENISNKSALIEDLEHAILKQYMISFSYTRVNESNKMKRYENVKPYKIIIFDGFWYLLTQYKEHYIKFYLKEISEVNILEQIFICDEKVLDRMNKALNIWFDPKVEPFDVTLLLNKNAIIYFERKPIKGQYLKKNNDGTGELTVSITKKEEIFAVLKKWLPQIRVIEPYQIQVEFEAMLKSYIGRS